LSRERTSDQNNAGWHQQVVPYRSHAKAPAVSGALLERRQYPHLHRDCKVIG
jgi:hypothetical protein